MPFEKYKQIRGIAQALQVLRKQFYCEAFQGVEVKCAVCLAYLCLCSVIPHLGEHSIFSDSVSNKCQGL